MADYPGEKRFEFRTGFGGLKWRGIVTEGDPGSVTIGSLRQLVNARVFNGEVQERAGLAKLHPNALQDAAACIRSIFSHDVATPKKLWLLGNGCPGVSSTAGYYVGTIDSEQDPEFQRAIYYSGTTNSVVIAKFNGEYYVGSDATLRKLQLINQPWGVEAIAVSGTSQDVPIDTFNLANGYAADYTIRCMMEFDSKLFIGIDNGAGASKVLTYDGISVREDKTGIDAPVCFGLYRIQNGGDAIMMGTATTNTIYIRPTGSSPTAWSSIGTHAAIGMVSYKDIMYIADGLTDVYKWDGATLASAHAPTIASNVRAVTTFNGLLYFAYDTATPSARIGKYDGTTWTDVDKNLTSQFNVTTTVRSLAAYRGALYACGLRSGNGRIFQSPQATTSGTWTEVVPNALSNGIVYYMTAF